MVKENMGLPQSGEEPQYKNKKDERGKGYKTYTLGQLIHALRNHIDLEDASPADKDSAKRHFEANYSPKANIANDDEKTIRAVSSSFRSVGRIGKVSKHRQNK